MKMTLNLVTSPVMTDRKDEIPPIKLMVASTVYHFKSDLEQLCATLKGFGYHVMNSHIGTIPALGKPPLQACLDAVAECDFFLGVIVPYYGSGITHDEIRRAIELDKPRCFLAHRDVTVARKLLEQYMYSDVKARLKNPAFTFKKTSVLDDIRVVDMYNEAIQDGFPVGNRRWAHEFTNYSLDGAPYINTQFRDMEKVREFVTGYKRGKK